MSDTGRGDMPAPDPAAGLALLDAEDADSYRHLLLRRTGG